MDTRFTSFGRGQPWWKNMLFGFIVSCVFVGLVLVYNANDANGGVVVVEVEPDPQVNAPPGVPQAWCNDHPAQCNRIGVYIAEMVDKHRSRNKDTYTAVTGTTRVDNKLKELGVRPIRIVGVDPNDGGYYQEWEAEADCVVNGYGCYPTAMDAREPLSQFEQVVLGCGATVAIARVPGANWALGLGAVNARQKCIWGVTAFFTLKWFGVSL